MRHTEGFDARNLNAYMRILPSNGRRVYFWGGTGMEGGVCFRGGADVGP